MPTTPEKKHWQDFADKWNRLGSPLRPCAEDVENFRHAMSGDPGRCLLLGVTPELADLTSQLTAIDNSAAMIGALWKNRREAILGDWLDLPFASGSFDTVIGDGCLTLLPRPVQHKIFFAQLHRVLAPSGKIVLRLFVSPEEGESCEFVCNEALAGKIKGFHAFKWRLSMAIASKSADRDLAVADTYRVFERFIPDREQLASATGWPFEDMETINVYRDSDARYSYPTLSQIRRSLHPALKEIGLIHGHYELAERCPILVLESRQ